MWWLTIKANTTGKYTIPVLVGRACVTDSHYLYIQIV